MKDKGWQLPFGKLLFYLLVMLETEAEGGQFIPIQDEHPSRLAQAIYSQPR